METRPRFDHSFFTLQLTLWLPRANPNQLHPHQGWGRSRHESVLNVLPVILWAAKREERSFRMILSCFLCPPCPPPFLQLPAGKLTSHFTEKTEAAGRTHLPTGAEATTVAASAGEASPSSSANEGVPVPTGRQRAWPLCRPLFQLPLFQLSICLQHGVTAPGIHTCSAFSHLGEEQQNRPSS